MFKYFNGRKYSLHKRFGRWMLSISLRVRLAHDVWNFYHPDDLIKKGEVIHHINGDKSDDRTENLQKMTRAKHTSLHVSGINNPFYGKHHSEESKKKISDTLEGHKASENTRRKMSELHRGNKHHNWKGSIKQKNFNYRL